MQSIEPDWVSTDEVETLAFEAVRDTKEYFFLRDFGLLESAVTRPQHHWHYGEEDLVALGVTLCIGIAQNHAFEQGNKRAGFEAMRLFFYKNGYDLQVPDADLVAEAIIEVLEEVTTEHDLAETLKGWMVPLD